MKTLLMSVAAILILAVGFVPTVQAQGVAEYLARDFVGYPSSRGFPPVHDQWRTPVMTYDAYTPFPGPMMAAPGWSRYGAGGTAYPTDEGFPPGHLFAPSTVMRPGSLYIYPAQRYWAPRWR
jgi:hypothetical protein